MRPLLFLLVISTSLTGYSQMKITKLDKNSMPKGLGFAGHVMEAIRWTDNTGDHIVITTETGERAGKTKDNEDYKDAALYAYHYLVKKDSFLLTWKMQDFVKECPLDVTAGFINNSLAITDLDKNGKPEIWLIYRVACRGDVSPASMKIIMYEADKKYGLRGESKVQVSENSYAGGEYRFDEAFLKAPELFRKYAEQTWKKYVLEKWD